LLAEGQERIERLLLKKRVAAGEQKAVEVALFQGLLALEDRTRLTTCNRSGILLFTDSQRQTRPVEHQKRL
jgi:hypothetical protein